MSGFVQHNGIPAHIQNKTITFIWSSKQSLIAQTKSPINRSQTIFPAQCELKQHYPVTIYTWYLYATSTPANWSAVKCPAIVSDIMETMGRSFIVVVVSRLWIVCHEFRDDMFYLCEKVFSLIIAAANWMYLFSVVLLWKMFWWNFRIVAHQVLMNFNQCKLVECALKLTQEFARDGSVRQKRPKI